MNGISRWWLLRLDSFAFRWICADAPCWKGEVQIGWLLVGWQKTRPGTEFITEPHSKPTYNLKDFTTLPEPAGRLLAQAVEAQEKVTQ